MKILFIAPLFDRVNGMSVASEQYLQHLRNTHDVVAVNLARTNRWSKIPVLGRTLQSIGIAAQTWRASRKSDVVYFTISESNLGILKDFLIYLALGNALGRTVIHLHGGGGMRNVMSKSKSLIKTVNVFISNRLSRLIVLGDSHRSIYADLTNPSKVQVVANFAANHLFVSETELEAKLSASNPIRVLFLSNLLAGKGHRELIGAFTDMTIDVRNQFRLDIAGEIMNDDDRNLIETACSEISQIKYHGIVSGAEKEHLFKSAHVFCLPTYNRTEGQPISILEAYASGCCVISTDQGGIPDIFEHGINGIEVKKRSAESVRLALTELMNNPELVAKTARHNNREANARFRTTQFDTSLDEILFATASNR